jgi:small subunit ribosomal protein S9
MADTKYMTAVGRRKTATASVKLVPAAKNTITVNGKPAADFFNTTEREMIANDPFRIEEVTEHYEVTARVSGGGVSAQAEAIRMAIARAIEKHQPHLRKPLKAAGYLKRDPRAVERKKPGLLKARKRPSWSKR